jgi:hypothetical protein
MVSSAGKQAFLERRENQIAAFLNAGIAVCLPDVRGTGETRVGTSAERGSSRTSVSQTNLILGQPVIGSQLRDLRTVIRWLGQRDNLDGKKIAMWGDSFAPTNERNRTIAVPHDASGALQIGEPGGGILAALARVYEDGVRALYIRDRLDSYTRLGDQPYLYLPHDAIIPGGLPAGDLIAVTISFPGPIRIDSQIDAVNRYVSPPGGRGEASKWVIEELTAK